jgi:hypothetical protein
VLARQGAGDEGRRTGADGGDGGERAYRLCPWRLRCERARAGRVSPTTFSTSAAGPCCPESRY